MKKRLLFAISQFYKGGAETSLLNLLKRLDREKYDIDLIIMDQSPADGSVSLIPALPAGIHVVDVWQAEQKLSFQDRCKRKLLCNSDDLMYYPSTALLYVRDKTYDWAFHVGEWWMPGFVATKVHAARKAAWIHNDLSEAEYFNADDFFRFDEAFEKYVFVSKRSLNASVKRYGFLCAKSLCIYNINDVCDIRARAKAAMADELPERKELTVLTCANVRKQKNHLRQLNAMKILKERGIEFTWLNIGSTVDTALIKKLLLTTKKYGLEGRFLLLGPKENPYQYMARADIVAGLSDYESWSMVITEAKVLGVPVIATKTSGALEQIEDGETGILCDFTAEDIADKLETFLRSKALQEHIRKNIRNFDNTEEILRSFEEMLDAPPSAERIEDRILYIIDNVNYAGGAHIATKFQIQALLQKGHDITVFSGEVPTAKIRTELNGARFIGWRDLPEDQLFHRRLLDCWTDARLTREQKKYKTKLTYEGKIRKNPDLFEEFVIPGLSALFSQYDIVCVMSESSAFRHMAAASACRRKIQYIHTDYMAWRSMSEWTRQITEKDGELYQKFDSVVLLSEQIRDRFLELYPHLKDKTVVNQNLMPVETIRKKAQEPEIKGTPAHFVTVCRIDRFKGVDRIYNALTKLYQDGYRFTWTIVGDGEDLEMMRALFANSDLRESVKMVGARSNPFQIVKKADVFALFSHYEGLPNTIYEAMILGIPVIATDVGGVATQIQNGVNGWLIDNDDDAVYEGIEHILLHPEEISRYKENLKNFRYQNEDILSKTEKIIFGTNV